MELRKAPLDYCCQDTLAIVEIFRALRAKHIGRGPQLGPEFKAELRQTSKS